MTHFGFMRGSVKVKLLIIGGVDESVVLCRWLLGELVSTPRGRLLDLEGVGGLSVSAPSAEPVNTCRVVRVAAAGRVMARSGWEKNHIKGKPYSLSVSLPPSLPLPLLLPPSVSRPSHLSFSPHPFLSPFHLS